MLLDLIFKIALIVFLTAMVALLLQGSLAKATVIAPLRHLARRIRERRAHKRSLAFALELEAQRQSANDFLDLLPREQGDYIRARLDLHDACIAAGHPEWYRTAANYQEMAA